MSKKEIEALVEQMNNYDELAAKVKAKADAIREAIKAEMVRLDVEELEAGAYATPTSSATALIPPLSSACTRSSTRTSPSRSAAAVSP